MRPTSISTLLPSSFPFWLAGRHTTVGHSRLLPEPLKPQRNISSQETDDSQKLQKTLQQLLSTGCILAQRADEKVRLLTIETALCVTRSEREVARGGEATLSAVAAMSLSVWLSDGSLPGPCLKSLHNPLLGCSHLVSTSGIDKRMNLNYFNYILSLRLNLLVSRLISNHSLSSVIYHNLPHPERSSTHANTSRPFFYSCQIFFITPYLIYLQLGKSHCWVPDKISFI